MKKGIQFAAIGISAIVVVGGIFAIQASIPAPVTLSPIENIDGIPFSTIATTAVITEKLAHSDVYLGKPVAFQQLHLHITFDPKNIQKLEVGVRENSFWLSYPRYTLFDTATDTNPTGNLITRDVTIPLTNTLQERDRSVDLMFFATTSTSQATEDEKEHDTTYWLLHALEADTSLTSATLPEIKDYIRSIVYRERAL